MPTQKFILFLVFALNGLVAIASPIPFLGEVLGGIFGGITATQPTRTGGRQAGGGPQSSVQAIDAAQQSWQRDTSIVSQFLSTAESMNPQQLQRQARVALAAENDELTHKAVLDQIFLSGSQKNIVASVQQADNVLQTQGTFQFVVDGLQTLSTKGMRMTPNQVSGLIQAINRDRCQQVLPAIDQYFSAAGSVVQNGNDLKAIRPSNC